MSDAKAESLSALLRELLGDALLELRFERGELTATVPATEIARVGLVLRDAPQLLFKLLLDVSGVDYQTYGQADWQTQNATAAGSAAVSVKPARPTPTATIRRVLPPFIICFQRRTTCACG